jgi:hypothetical protein
MRLASRRAAQLAVALVATSISACKTDAVSGFKSEEPVVAPPVEDPSQQNLPAEPVGGPVADEVPDFGTVIDLAKFKGSTFFEAVSLPGGIKEQLEVDIVRTFAVTDRQSFRTRLTAFDDDVFPKLRRLFKNGDQDVDAMLEPANPRGIAGRQVNPESITPSIRNAMNACLCLVKPDELPLSAVKMSPVLSLISGGGVTIRLDESNKYLNIGYKAANKDSPQDVIDKAVKSGRSFGISRGRKALDVSDVVYLDELEAFYQANDPRDFYRALMRLLTQSDASGLKILPELGQTVATDFLAVYTAELDRHLMTGLTQHPFENDLAESTFLSLFIAKAHLLVVDRRVIDKTQENGALVPPRPHHLFRVGTNGSGLGGRARADRKLFQRRVADAERKLHPELFERLAAALGVRPSVDMMDALTAFLNNPANQAKVRANADEIVEATALLMGQIGDDAATIRAELLR